jgi:O-methyltransferase
MKLMHYLLPAVRTIKPLWIKLRLDRWLKPFLPGLQNLVNLSHMAYWISNQKKPAFNDFYSSTFDYQKRIKLYEYLLGTYCKSEPITYLEFGVAGGQSFEWWVKNQINGDSKFYGFDTFEGLPEKWGHLEAGSMTAYGLFPTIQDARISFIKGLFQTTLPSFLKSNDFTTRTVIHMDADLYTSTLYVLTSIAPHLKAGDIIFFDEFLVPSHEFLAWKNFTDSYYIKTEMIGAANNYYFTAFMIK